MLFISLLPKSSRGLLLRCGPVPAASAIRRSLVKMQHLSSNPRATKSESAFSQYSQVICMHMKF